MHKSILNVAFILDVFMCCCLLHNMLRSEDEVSIRHLFHIIELEGNFDQLEDIQTRDVDHDVLEIS